MSAWSTRAANGWVMVSQATRAETARKAAAATLVAMCVGTMAPPTAVRGLRGRPRHARRWGRPRRRRRRQPAIVGVQALARVATPRRDAGPHGHDAQEGHHDRDARV